MKIWISEKQKWGRVLEMQCQASLLTSVLWSSSILSRRGKKSIQCLTHPWGWYRAQEELLCKGLNTDVATEQKENEKQVLKAKCVQRLFSWARIYSE